MSAVLPDDPLLAAGFALLWLFILLGFANELRWALTRRRELARKDRLRSIGIA